APRRGSWVGSGRCAEPAREDPLRNAGGPVVRCAGFRWTGARDIARPDGRAARPLRHCRDRNGCQGRALARCLGDLASAERRAVALGARRAARGRRRGPRGVSASRLLLVTYYYPPQPGSGSNRWAALAKYLRRIGHDVAVL